MSIFGAFLGGAAGAAVGQLVVQIVADSTGLKAGLDDAKKSAKGFADAILSGKGLGAALGALSPAAIAGVAVAGVAAVTAALVDCTSKAVEFETGMAGVMTQLPGMGKDVEAELTEVIRDLQREMGVLSSDSIPAMYDALSAGVSKDDIGQFMETASKMSIGGLIDTGTAVDGLTSAVNAYGSDVLDVETASDILFTTIRLGKVDMAELATSLSNVTPLAAAAGVGLDQVGAAVATLTMSGTKTSVATTQMRALFSELSKSSSLAAQSFKDEFGKTFLEYIDDGGTLQGALSGLAEHAEKSGKSVIDMFGSIEAGSTALTLTTSGAETFADALQQMNDSAGATEQAYDTMADTVENRMKVIEGKFNDVQERIGTAFLPILENTIVPALGGVADALGWLFEVAGNNAALSPLTHIMDAFGKWWDDHGTEISEKLATIWNTLFGSEDDGPSPLVEAIDKVLTLLIDGPVMAALDLLLAVLSILTGDWDGAWESMGDAVRDFATPFQGIISGITGSVTTAETNVKGFADGVKSAFSGAYDTIAEKVTGAYDTIAEKVSGVKQTISDTWSWLANAAYTAWEGLTSWFWGGIDELRNGILSFAAEPVKFVTDAVAGVIDVIDSGVDTVLTGIETFGQGVVDFWTNIWNSLIQGIQDFVNNTLSILDPILKPIAEFFGFELPEIDLSGYQITAPTISIERPDVFKNASAAVRETGQNIVNNIYQTNNFPDVQSPYEASRRISQENKNLWRTVI